MERLRWSGNRQAFRECEQAYRKLKPRRQRKRKREQQTIHPEVRQLLQDMHAKMKAYCRERSQGAGTEAYSLLGSLGYWLGNFARVRQSTFEELTDRFDALMMEELHSNPSEV